MGEPAPEVVEIPSPEAFAKQLKSLVTVIEKAKALGFLSKVSEHKYVNIGNIEFELPGDFSNIVLHANEYPGKVQSWSESKMRFNLSLDHDHQGYRLYATVDNDQGREQQQLFDTGYYQEQNEHWVRGETKLEEPDLMQSPEMMGKIFKIMKEYERIMEQQIREKTLKGGGSGGIRSLLSRVFRDKRE